MELHGFTNLFASSVVATAAAAMGCSGGGAAADQTPATVSCTIASENICTQIVAPEDEVSAENMTCTTIESGTPGTGCSTSGLVGCCHQTSTGEAAEVECYYNASTAMTGQMTCTAQHGTWSTTP